MSIVNEFIHHDLHDESGVNIYVCERTSGEMIDAWKIVKIESDIQYMTPVEMRNLGKWLVAESKRIGREYTATGKRKASKEPT